MRVILLILLFFIESAFATSDDICGTYTGAGVGGTADCPVDTFPSGCIDKDRDGYCVNTENGPLTGIDCNDQDRYVYPGAISTVSCSANEAKLCNADGTFGACSSGGYCPAGYTCYYFSPSGSDSTGTGTFANPWATPDMFSYRSTGSPPAGFVTPGPSKAMIFLSGTYSTGFTTNTKKYWATLRSTNGLADSTAFLIMGIGFPIIDATATDVTPFNIQQSSYVHISGFEVTGNTCSNTYDSGCVGFTEGSHNKAYNLKVHDNTGNCSGNLGGMYTHSESDWEGHHLLLYNNVGAGGCSADNNSNFMNFRTTNFSWHDSISYYASSASGYTPVRGKHSNADSSVTLERNVLVNGRAKFSSPSITLRNNYLEECDFLFEDSGGPAFFSYALVEKNTVRRQRLINFLYTRGWTSPPNSGTAAADRCSGTPITPTGFTFQQNVQFKNAADTSANRSWDMGAFLPETLVSDFQAVLTMTNNLYYNSTGAATFDWYEVNNGDNTCGGSARGSSGSSYTLSQVKSVLSKESDSYEEDPSFVSGSWIAESANSTGKGWNVDWGTGPAPTPTATPTPEPSGSRKNGQYSYSKTKGQR